MRGIEKDKKGGIGRGSWPGGLENHEKERREISASLSLLSFLCGRREHLTTGERHHITSCPSFSFVWSSWSFSNNIVLFPKSMQSPGEIEGGKVEEKEEQIRFSLTLMMIERRKILEKRMMMMKIEGGRRYGYWMYRLSSQAVRDWWIDFSSSLSVSKLTTTSFKFSCVMYSFTNEKRFLVYFFFTLLISVLSPSSLLFHICLFLSTPLGFY